MVHHLGRKLLWAKIAHVLLHAEKNEVVIFLGEQGTEIRDLTVISQRRTGPVDLTVIFRGETCDEFRQIVETRAESLSLQAAKLRMRGNYTSLAKLEEDLHRILQMIEAHQSLGMALAPRPLVGIALDLILKEVFGKGGNQCRSIGPRVEPFATRRGLAAYP